MRFTVMLLVMLSVLLLNICPALCAPSDVGHVEFVELENPTPYTPNINPEKRDTVVPNTAALREVTLTPEMKQKISELFPNVNKEVYSLVGNKNIIMNAEARELSDQVRAHIEAAKEEIILAFPEFTASEAGIYVLGVVMNNIADALTLIDSISSITRTNVSSAADIQQIVLLDQKADRTPIKRATNGMSYALVPENQNMLVAVNLNAGESWTGSLTKPSQLPIIIVENITIEQIVIIAEQTDPRTQGETHEETVSRITDNIIEAIQEIIAKPEVAEYIISKRILSGDILSRDITSADIKTFTSKDVVSDPEEPTQSMLEAVKQEGYEIAAKLNTVQVAESGFYIFKVTLSEQSFKELYGQETSALKVYALNDSEVEIKASFITGLINTFELLTMSGEKMDSIGLREFLLIGLLESGKPLSFYLAKIILMLLMGGCNLSLGAVAILVVTAKIFHGKFHVKRK